jgi:hypothetical protein
MPSIHPEPSCVLFLGCLCANHSCPQWFLEIVGLPSNRHLSELRVFRNIRQHASCIPHAKSETLSNPLKTQRFWFRANRKRNPRFRSSPDISEPRMNPPTPTSTGRPCRSPLPSAPTAASANSMSRHWLLDVGRRSRKVSFPATSSCRPPSGGRTCRQPRFARTSLHSSTSFRCDYFRVADHPELKNVPASWESYALSSLIAISQVRFSPWTRRPSIPPVRLLSGSTPAALASCSGSRAQQSTSEAQNGARTGGETTPLLLGERNGSGDGK